MSLHLLASKPFVPQGSFHNTNPPVIRFSADGRGLPIIAAKNMTVPVANGSSPAMQGSGVANSSITFRTIWPGYTHDFTARTINGGALDRTRLAAEVAKHVLNYFNAIKTGRIASADPASGGIIERGISMQNIYLEGIVNTSGTCWQPILYLGGPGFN